jgi:hypothetical protein
MTILISAGDSFTYGTELHDCDPGVDPQHSNSTWAGLLAKHYNMDYCCTAVAGSGNGSIARRCIYKVNELLNQNEDIVVGIMWTYIHRFEMSSKFTNEDIDIYEEKFQTISSFHAMTPTEKIKAFGEKFPANVSSSAYRKFIKRHEWDESAGVGDISRIFQKHMDNRFYLVESFKNMLLLQHYLENKKIKYFFLKAANIGMDHEIDPYMSSMRDMIKTANWLQAPYFLEWAKERKYEVGFANHPLEAAHRDYAEEYVIPYLKPIMNGES